MNGPSLKLDQKMAQGQQQGYSKEYLYVLFSRKDFRSRLQGLVTGTSKSHQRVSPQKLMDVRTGIASPEVVSAFDQFASPLIQKVSSNQIQSQTLAALHDLLLPKLISGKIRLSDAEKAVEEAV